MNCPAGMRKWWTMHRKLFTLVAFAFFSCIVIAPDSALAREKKEQHKKCRYNKSGVKWGACDPYVHVKTKAASLIRSRSRNDCPKVRTYTEPCDLESISYDGCEYIQVSGWSECDDSLNTKTRTLELRSGTTQLCDNTRLESRECVTEVEEDTDKANTSVTRQKKKGNKKDRERRRKKTKQKKKKQKTVVKNDCLYKKGKWKACDKETGFQSITHKLKKSEEASNCDPIVTATRKCNRGSEKNGVELKEKRKLKRKGKNSKKKKKKNKKKSSKRTKKKKENENEVSPIPPRLTELHVVPYTDFVVVSWKPPQDEETGRPVPVDGYQVGYGRGFPDVYTVRLNASVVSHRIENLEPGGEYVISVRASNQVGTGQALYDTVMTRADDKGASTPLLPPVGVVSCVMSSKAINVSWADLSIKGQTTPTNRSYYLRYRQLNHLTPQSTPSVYNNRFKTLHTKNMYLVVSDLLPFTKYEFAVSTSTGQKNSTWSVMVWNITDQDVPGDTPTDLTYIIDPASPKQVILSWQPPTKPNGIITGYEISYQTSLEEGRPLETKVSVEGNKLYTTLTSLIPGVPYDLSVRARNVKGVGPYKTIQKYTLPGDPVPVPAKLKVFRLKNNPTAVRLIWEIPDPVDVDILGFVILYTSDLKSNPVHWQVESRIGKDLRMTVLEDLEPGMKYAFKIQAHTSVGFGPESNTAITETGKIEENNTDSSGPPTNFRIKTLSATSVVASWQDPKASRGLEMKMPDPNPVYKLRYRNLDPQPASYTEVTVYFQSFYLNDLSPLTQYEFSVCAVQCDDEAQWTKPVVKTTFTVDFSRHPLKVEVKGQKNSPHVAVLSWQPHSGANFKEYVAMYTTDPSKPHKHWVQKSAVSLDARQETFYDLKPGTTYFFFVQAMTDVGFGPRSKVVSYATPEEDKSSPSLPHPVKLQAVMVSSSSVVLLWRDPQFVYVPTKDKKGNSQTARTYTIRYRDLGMRSSGYKFLSTSVQSLFLVTLNPATQYEFSVRVNRGGKHSVWSPPVTNSTFEAAPASAPCNITVSMDNNDPTSVILSWKSPQLPNGKITGYIVFYTTNQKQSLRKVSVESVSGNAHNHHISFLRPHKTYFFKMRAHNKKGYSPLSETTVYKTPKVIGGPPHTVTVEPVPENPYDALVTWQPPANNKRKIKYYTLTYNTEDRKNRTVERLSADSQQTIINDLQASTTYHLSVQAFYSRGAGPHSVIAKYSIPKELIQKLNQDSKL